MDCIILIYYLSYIFKIRIDIGVQNNRDGPLWLTSQVFKLILLYHKYVEVYVLQWITDFVINHVSRFLSSASVIATYAGRTIRFQLHCFLHWQSANIVWIPKVR